MTKKFEVFLNLLHKNCSQWRLGVRKMDDSKSLIHRNKLYFLVSMVVEFQNQMKLLLSDPDVFIYQKS